MLMTTQPSSRKVATKTSRPRAAAKSATPRATTAKSKIAASSRTARASASKKVLAKPESPKTPSKPAAQVDSTPDSKQARLIALLGSAPGATIDQMMQLTGWQAHSVRGAISGVLRKRLGLNVACVAGDAGTVYRIVNAVLA
jgi:hypothetical protein